MYPAQKHWLMGFVEASEIVGALDYKRSKRDVTKSIASADDEKGSAKTKIRLRRSSQYTLALNYKSLLTHLVPVDYGQSIESK